jgi:hypothetical protein
VPARKDICDRLPDFSGCPKSGNAQVPAVRAATPAAVTAAPATTTTLVIVTVTTPKPKGTTTISPEIKKLCQQYAGLAKQYCIGGPNEIPMAREKCDYWRKYCKGIKDESTESPLGGPPCAPYETQ